MALTLNGGPSTYIQLDKMGVRTCDQPFLLVQIFVIKDKSFTIELGVNTKGVGQNCEVDNIITRR